MYSGTLKNSNTLRFMDGIFCWPVLVYIDCNKYNQNNICLCYCQKMIIIDYGMISIHDLCTGQHNEFGYISDCDWN